MVNFSLILINFHSVFCFIMFSNSICIPIFSPTAELYKKADLFYIMFSDRVGWIEARSICQTYEAELAIPNTTFKAEALAYFIKMSNSQYQQFWIGAYHNNNQWLWSNNNQSIENINFTEINHNTLNSENKCLVQKKQFYFKPLFAEQMCFFPKPFICERSTFAEIRNPLLTLAVKSIKINSSVFTIYHSKVSLNEAVAFCRSLDQRLAVVSDNFTLYALTRALLQSRPYIENAWIGGYYYNYIWVWLANGNQISSKTDLPWIKKNNSNFTEACLLFGRHLNQPYFVPSRCEKKKSFICEKLDDVIPDKSKIKCFDSNIDMTIYLTNKTWYDAQKFCQSKNSTLIDICNKTMFEKLRVCLADQYLAPKHFWLAAIRKRTNWIWASSYKNMNSSAVLCSDVFEPHTECLNLDMSNNDKYLLYGIPCKREQAFVCSKHKFVHKHKNHCVCPCKQHSVSISHNSKTYLVLLFVIAYERVDYYCKRFGGKIIDSTLPQNTKSYIFSYIEQLLVSCCCPLDRINIWLKSESNTSCTTLNAKSFKINTTVECTKKNAFICQIDCRIPTNILTNVNDSTKCELIKKSNGYSYNSCTFHCPDGYCLFGPSKFICDAYGWSIRSGNKEVSFLYPECIKIKHARDGFIDILKNLNYQGYYFIIKEQANWEKIKHFIINFIRIFGVSKDFPMGLMTFGKSVDVRIPYNGTDICKVISKINETNIPSNENNIANYNLAFHEMQDQILKYRPNKPALIVFIADSKNTGESYTKVLRKIKRKNIVFVLGITKNIVEDFDMVANIPINHRLHTIKVKNHNDFYNMSIELQKHKDWTKYC